MSTARSMRCFFALAVAIGLAGTATVAPAAEPAANPASSPAEGGILSNGGFSLSKKSAEIRKFQKQGWYESRRDGEGHKLVFLSKKRVSGNATPKAMVRADAKRNTYLTQDFDAPQSGDFILSYDVLVKEILPPANRSAFFMIGDNADKKQGPNSTGSERFVFAGFENAAEKGKINFFAREGNGGWDQRTIIAKGLDLDKWYRIQVTVHPGAGTYEVKVAGVAGGPITPQPVLCKAFAPSGKPPRNLTAVSFASWNDGPGTFYIDNVAAQRK